ncbi:SDR family NAD(P)-dependent oxidoreductase [Candidatus Methanodesulfokora washburnensis]|uniref:SDR family oxidoreductase n=1 Tax=Candidatus Methanodesulfokora washburnensis TaxID=2478471 RepID=A0A429GSV3_9CREN|nr:SDR family oxidoreductase [Candidatus Methanodesulfokores washburnensis]RSN76910.1 SDR family oxidoreductase [Candidatus Methanodesulfokores washburnensis]
MSSYPQISLSNKVALVTGGSSGIGRAIALKLSQAGAKVAILDIKECEDLLDEIGRDKARFYRCDVTSAEEVKETVNRVYGDFGRIDIVVNAAGIIIRKDAVETSEEEWDRVLNVNLKGPFLVSKYSIPYMIRGGGGSIVNIASGWGLKGGPKAVAYCASKGGLVNMTRAMAIDHGKNGIRVNCVAPGDVDTPMLRSEAKQLGISWEDFLKDASNRPLARIGRPEDIANAVLFLASGMASWITGATLVVDGGGIA